ncbi:MAG: type II secretion system protein GspM [Burkholderiaceae bacterium]
MKGGAFLESLLGRWGQLNLRERRLVSWGAAIVALAIIYFVLFEPAWLGRTRLRDELPQLRAQVAKLEALSAEAGKLAKVRQSSKAQAVVRSELQRSITAAGLDSSATVNAGSDIIQVKFDQVTMASVLTWLYGATRDVKLRVVDVKVVKDVDPGRVAATISLERPGSDQ